MRDPNSNCACCCVSIKAPLPGVASCRELALLLANRPGWVAVFSRAQLGWAQSKLGGEKPSLATHTFARGSGGRESAGRAPSSESARNPRPSVVLRGAVWQTCHLSNELSHRAPDRLWARTLPWHLSSEQLLAPASCTNSKVGDSNLPSQFPFQVQLDKEFFVSHPKHLCGLPLIAAAAQWRG